MYHEELSTSVTKQLMKADLNLERCCLQLAEQLLQQQQQQWNGVTHNNWLAQCLTDWPSDSLREWPCDCLTDQQAIQPINRPVDWLLEWISVWVTG